MAVVSSGYNFSRYCRPKAFFKTAHESLRKETVAIFNFLEIAGPKKASPSIVFACNDLFCDCFGSAADRSRATGH